MHCIILQNLFLFILFFLLSFIKHQNIFSVLRSHIFRQSCPAGLHAARTRSSGPNPACCFLRRYQKSVKTRRVFFYLISRVTLADGTAAGDAGSRLQLLESILSPRLWQGCQRGTVWWELPAKSVQENGSFGNTLCQHAVMHASRCSVSGVRGKYCD